MDGQDMDYVRRAEEALRVSEERLRLIVERAPAAIAVCDLDMHYLAVSRRFRTDYGLGGGNLIGRDHYDVFPDTPERWKTIHRRCLAGATEKAEDEPVPRRDGQTDWV